MTNEVCLFHPFTLFFSHSHPQPPQHTPPYPPTLPSHFSLFLGAERKGEFMWERLTATQSNFHSAPPPAYFTFLAAGHVVHANTQAGEPIRTQRGEFVKDTKGL